MCQLHWTLLHTYLQIKIILQNFIRTFNTGFKQVPDLSFPRISLFQPKKLKNDLGFFECPKVPLFFMVVFDPSENRESLHDGYKSVRRWVSLGTYQASFRLDEGSILAVHLVVKSAGVAEVVSGAVSSPQRRRCRSAIHTLATLYRNSTNKAKVKLILRQLCSLISKNYVQPCPRNAVRGTGFSLSRHFQETCLVTFESVGEVVFGTAFMDTWFISTFTLAFQTFFFWYNVFENRELERLEALEAWYLETKGNLKY